MICGDALAAYGLRSIGLGERLLPRGDITLCEQIVLIGSGMIWNLYFAGLAVVLGFCFATLIALGMAREERWLRGPAKGFVFLFRGSPLFIQFFFAYELFVLLPKGSIEIPLGLFSLEIGAGWMSRAWAGALVVLFLNTSAYSAQIFHGALMAVPRGDIEAAEAYGMSGWRRFRRIVWPTMLRLAWPSYTNEAIFLFHATTLVFFSGFPAWRQEGDALYYANYFAEQTYNPFVPYPIAAAYFVLATLGIIVVFGLANRRLNRHVAPSQRRRLRYRPQLVR